MSLKKTIASKDGGYEIEMHILEEDSIRSFWSVQEIKDKIPTPLTIEQEHELLIEQGADRVKAKRAEWKALHDLHQPDIEAKEKVYKDKHDKWCRHVETCISHGFSPDTFEGDASEKLTGNGHIDKS